MKENTRTVPSSGSLTPQLEGHFCTHPHPRRQQPTEAAKQGEGGGGQDE